MKLYSKTALIGLIFLLGCNSDPSAFKIPVPDKVVKDFTGTISTYNPAVDILFIIDDSGSMNTYQDRLAQNAGLFIDKFFKAQFIDFHIGVTTSTETGGFGSGNSKAPNGRLYSVNGHSFVTRETADLDFVVRDLMDIGTGGAGTERFLSIPQKAFSESAQKSYNKGFLRDDAHLLIFVLTDTRDQSKVDPKKTYDFLLNLKKGDATKLHYTIANVTIEKLNCEAETDTLDEPRNLRLFADYFHSRGHRLNICQSDYGNDLARVAKNVVEAVSTVYLNNLPDVSTMEVYYGDKLIPNKEVGGWTYDYSLNAIHLSPDIDVQGKSGEKLNIRFEEIYKAE